MSDTPRTDAIVNGDWNGYEKECRKLERELTELTQAVADQRERGNSYKRIAQEAQESALNQLGRIEKLTKALAEAEGRLAEYRTRNDSLSQELGNASLKFMEENTAFSQRCAKLRDLLVESRGYLDRMGQEGIRDRINAILATEPNTSGEGK